jgi:hypothetical protein
MSPVDKLIDELRAEAARASDPGRVAPLCNLGQALLQRFNYNGLRAPGALPDLNEAVAALEKVREHLAVDDPLRARTSALLGFACSYRTSYLNDGKDDDTAISCLEEALSSGNLPKTHEPLSRIMLGMAYLRRVMTPTAMTDMLMGGLTRGTSTSPLLTDIDRGEACFRAVLEKPSISKDIRESCDLMIGMTEALRVMCGGSSGTISLGNFSEFLQRMQELQAQVTSVSQPGFGAFHLSDVFEISKDKTEKLYDSTPANRPVMVVHAESSEDDRPVEQPTVVPGTAVQTTSAEEEPAFGKPRLRKVLWEKLSLAAPVWDSASALLLPEAVMPQVSEVDDAVALAATVLDGEEQTSPEDDAVDHYLLAVLLFLRNRHDSDGDGTDLRAAADALLTAARLVPPDHAAAVVITRSLGAFLDADGGVLDRVAAGLAGRIDAVLSGVTDEEDRADLTALRAVCRAAWAVVDANKAVANISSRYPWPDALRAAARTVR